LISFTRKNALSAELQAERTRRKEPPRYDRTLVFMLLLVASAFILSHSVFDTEYAPILGQVVENDIYAPHGFVFVDYSAARKAAEAEFQRLPAPYVFDLSGFDAAVDRLRRYFVGDDRDTAVATLVIANPARRARALRRIDDLVERARRVGLLDKAYESERMLSISGPEGIREGPSTQVMQPGHWERYLQGLDEDEIARVSGLLDKFLLPTLKYDEARAERRYEELLGKHEPQRLEFSPERPIIMAGQELDAGHVEILEQLGRFSHRRNYLALAGLLGFLALTLLFGAVYTKKYLPAIYDRLRDVAAISFIFGAGLLICLVTSLIVARLPSGPFRLSNAAMPAAATAMVLTLLYDARISLIYSLFSSALVTVVIAPRLVLLVMFIFGSLTASITAASSRRRSDVFRCGLVVAAVQMVIVVLLGVLHGEPFGAMRIDILSAILSGFLAAIVSQMLLLPLEAISRRVSTFTLLELGDLNHPLLQLLLRKAPGTFQHSQHVALLAQSAADVIGANSLLTRVGAYFHDIGKMRKPEYFTENQAVHENPHDRLKPSLSAAVIRAHVLDGVAMAQEERLPEPVVNFIREHHGTATISIFYHRALELAGEDEDVNRGDYQYPGPRPQSQETGLVMLADAVEAATRSLAGPSAAKIERTVKKIIADIFESGQLDECDLTLRDLTIVADEFTHVLCGIHHTRRIEYPDADEIADAEKKKSS
jgi:putative nucleotidyltransferase with HDIG domain